MELACGQRQPAARAFPVEVYDRLADLAHMRKVAIVLDLQAKA